MTINVERDFISIVIIFKDPEYAILITDDRGNELLLFKAKEYKDIVRKIRNSGYEFDYVVADTQAFFLINYLNIKEEVQIKEIFKYENELPLPKGNQIGEDILNLIRRVGNYYVPQLIKN